MRYVGYQIRFKLLVLGTGLYGFLDRIADLVDYFGVSFIVAVHFAGVEIGIEFSFIYAVYGIKYTFSFKPSVKQKDTGQSVKDKKNKKRNDHEITEKQHTCPECVKYKKSKI